MRFVHGVPMKRLLFITQETDEQGMTDIPVLFAIKLVAMLEEGCDIPTARKSQPNDAVCWASECWQVTGNLHTRRRSTIADNSSGTSEVLESICIHPLAEDSR